MKNLYDLNINKTAKIHSLDNSYESTARLSEMGIVPGSSIRIIKKNTIIEICTYHMMIVPLQSN